ncbi:MAG: hypothetical protein RIT03_858 [Bacteroidota bacterium]|jgi:gliding motility-associated-like protein
MKVHSLLLYLCLCTLAGYGQFSKTHYLPPLSGSDSPGSSAQEQYLYISTPNLSPVNFTIKQLGGQNIYGTVSKTNPYVFDCGYGSNTQLVVQNGLVGSVLNNKGYIIEAEDLIYVTARLIAGNGNQSGAVVSKGIAALGKEFRVGSLLNPNNGSLGNNVHTFIAILATENNTTVQFGDIQPGVTLINNPGGSNPAPVTLNSGESYVLAVEGPSQANLSGLIGSKVIADKPIAVNCGSFTGSNASQNLDLGFDQIVSAERTGKEYIFIKSTGQDIVERILLIAHEDNTEIYLNGNTTAAAYTLNAGNYIALDGSNYSANGNLYVSSSKNVFAYQTIGDNSRTDFANQELFFVPPLSCETPHVIDNIPLINQIGSRIYPIARVTLLTETAATVSFEINSIPYTLGQLAFLPGVTVNGPIAVVGNPAYETYSITGLSGNVAVFSSAQLYLAAYGTDGAATFGGFFSGFTFKPEVSFDALNVAQSNCIPNTTISVNSISPFDVFQWYFNNTAIPGATANSYLPLAPGYYYVKATIATCSSTLVSDNIPVSACANNTDNDAANDNVDLDWDNDGIPNCTESLGNQPIDLSDSTLLNIQTSGPALPVPTPVSGTTLGNFIAETPIGKGNSVQFTKSFPQATAFSLQYPITGDPTALLDGNVEFIINSDVTETVTVLNPANQLLIDTNYDGYYESNVTQFSSFEVRFRLNNAAPLAFGTANFSFQSASSSSFRFTQINLSDTNLAKVQWELQATCVPRDGDGDGVPDALDLDSDNDGLLDSTEAQALNLISPVVDANSDGLYDEYVGLVLADTDSDGIPDYLDLDSDNDGIFDLVESGCGASDTNYNGMIDTTAVFGSNGLANSLETTPESGQLNYTLANADLDAAANYIDLDSDDDGCLDALEAGYLDGNADGMVGNTSPVTVNSWGVVTNAASGYTPLPNLNYTISAPISITTQPISIAVCALQNTSFTVDSSPVDSYQWQQNIAGVWTNLSNSSILSGTQTNQLQFTGVPTPFDGATFRVLLQKNGNSCNLISDAVTLTVYPLPVVNISVIIKQCDDDALTDGFTFVNLKSIESQLSAQAAVETFSYYTSQIAAQAGNTASPDYIAAPEQFFTNSATVWVRVENANTCFSIGSITILVSATQIPASFSRSFAKCDDFLDLNGNNTANNDDHDGIAGFNFSSVTAAVSALLPATSSYTIKYYKNGIDAAVETDALGNSLEISQNAADPNSIFNYRNIGYPNQQDIWIRVKSTIDNACYALGPYIHLTVEALPTLTAVAPGNIIRTCDDNHDGKFLFDTSALDTTLLNGQTQVTLAYFDASGNPLSSPLPNPFLVDTTTTVTVRATNTLTADPNGACFEEATLTFIVDDLPEVFPISSALTQLCDDEYYPALQNGTVGFDSAAIETALLNGQTGLNLLYTDGAGQPMGYPIQNPLNSASQTLTVTMQNAINNNCAVSTTIPLVVLPLPMIDLNELGTANVLICSDDPTFTRILDAGVLPGTNPADYSYQWFLDGTAIASATQNTLTVNTEGTYTVEVSTASGCPKTRTIEVTASEKATITSIDVVDITETNSITVNTSGLGTYIYSLDYPDFFQPSNYFYNTAPGNHVVYVKDINGCGTIGPVEVNVLGIPNFFTPNGDGSNDTWNVKGVTATYNANTVIRIFDRMGKLMKEISPLGTGWDGTFNGADVPSDDYWYVILFEDQRLVKGHFSLKR